MPSLSFLLAAIAVADLPVHCTRSQVLGEWSLFLGTPSADRTSCGHKRPDAPHGQPEIKLASSTEMKVTFADKGQNKVVVQHESKEDYFSMVYDEGFEFDVDDKAFFAFSRFDLVGTKNISRCDETELGWYSNKDRSEFGCWYGKKTVPLASHKAAEPVVLSDKPISREEHEKKVSFINTKSTTWRAKVYDQYVGKSVAEMSRRAGNFKSQSEAPKREMSFLSMDMHAAMQKSKALVDSSPTSLDWREKDGKNYLEPVMDQGDCGSCYIVASMRMLNTRHHINLADKYERERDLFSMSFPLYCSEYNQGCEGGFSNLVARWSQDVGFVPARCAPYTTSGSCSVAKECLEDTPKYRANNHRYVGGYYGKANEGEMMKELENGPYAVGLAVGNDFMYYTEGVYHGVDMQPIAKDPEGWQEMQHAVLLVGYGEEDGTKYWIIQNSWGPDWGEDGYIRMRRGENDSGIESSPEAADVVQDDTVGDRINSFLTQNVVHSQVEAKVNFF